MDVRRLVSTACRPQGMEPNQTSGHEVKGWAQRMSRTAKPAKVQLEQEWELGDRIGEGGFAEVYEATRPGADPAVAKLIPKSPGADRELLFVELSGARNVIPVLDHGETQDYWVLVMPRAATSLRQSLQASGGSLEVKDAILVLTDILDALIDIQGRVVHRDLKPENILLHDGAWCLADFGISRYAEASTSEHTRKYSMTVPYAAPEQWRGERASSATDIYALGCIAFELLDGSLPFEAGTVDEWRAAHLHEKPRALQNVPDGLASVVALCLLKAQDARPDARRLREKLAAVRELPASGGLAALASVGRRISDERAEAESRASMEASRRDRLASLQEAGEDTLARVLDAVSAALGSTGPVDIVRSHVGWRADLADATLEFTQLRACEADALRRHGFSGFDVACFSEVRVTSRRPMYGYQGRSHSLWFCNAREETHFAWYETAFMTHPLMSQGIVSGVSARKPFALAPGENAAAALQTGMAPLMVAWPFTELDISDLATFIDRWAGWLAKAAAGQLAPPSSMPELDPVGSWRG